MRNKQIKAGDVLATNEGGSVTVIEYINSRNVLVEHNDSHKHRAAVMAQHLRNGRAKNPYFPSVYAVGYVGTGEYAVSIGGKNTSAYSSWGRMLQRCYDPKLHAKRPTYIGCSVHVDWHNYQNYAAWFHAQPNSQNTGFELDKDLLILNNKVYSSETCSFVPQEINTLLTDRGASRGKHPVGVSAGRKGYQAQLRVKGKLIYLGIYSSPEQAFSVYKKAKEENVRSMAVEWREYLHPTVYANLMAYEV